VQVRSAAADLIEVAPVDLFTRRPDETGGGQGHYFTTANGWDRESALIQAFIARASVAHLDTGCLAAISAPAFP
jgi:hypothetical protein